LCAAVQVVSLAIMHWAPAVTLALPMAITQSELCRHMFVVCRGPRSSPSPMQPSPPPNHRLPRRSRQKHQQASINLRCCVLLVCRDPRVSLQPSPVRLPSLSPVTPAVCQSFRQFEPTDVATCCL
jgi:hypothetical protein